MSKTPKLRFKEFSGDWETQKAKELFESISDKNHNGDLEVLSATQDRGVIPRSELNIDIKYEQNNLASYKKVKESDFIISLRSFQGGIEHSHYTGLVSPAYTVFNFKNNIDSNHRFFAEIFKTQNFINRLNTLTYGIRDGKAISFKDFSDVKLSFPSKEEQEKIASLFSLIDEKISLQNNKIDNLKEYKKGMMQKIFSRELRFKDDDGRDYPEWEVKKLEKLTSIKKGKQLNKLDLLESGKYYALNGGIEPSGYTNNYNTEGDTISISEGGNSCGYVNYNKERFWSGGHCYTLEDLKHVESKFLYQALKFNQDKIMKLRVGSGLPNIQKKDLNLFSLNIPSLPEQEKIASFLSEIDNKIELEQDKLDKLKEYKKGLLQQMFI